MKNIRLVIFMLLFLNQFLVLDGITGGATDANPKEIPYMVKLKVYHTACEGTLCGGTLIDPYNVLTAAHCLTKFMSSDSPYARISIFRQTSIKTEPWQVDVVSRKDQVHIHPDYQNSPDVDMALINLSGMVYSSHYAPLDTDTNRNIGSVNVKIYGWGVIMYPYVLPLYLQKATVPLSDPIHCERKYDGEFSIQVHVCIEVKQLLGPCKGDSGGPVIYAGNQIAVMSKAATSKCGDGFGRSVKVAPFLTWINDRKSCPAVDGPPTTSFVDVAADAVCLIENLEVDPFELLEIVYTYYHEGPFLAFRQGFKILLQKFFKWILRHCRPFY